MTAWDISEIRTLLADASAIALDHYESPEISIKGDRTIVTKADRAIEELLGSRLDRPGEGSYLIGEETVERRDESYIRDAFSAVAWIVDPIDGTVPYAHHIPTWGISIGMMRRGSIAEGAVYLPVTGELFMTDGDTVLFGRGAPGEVPIPRPFTPVRAPADESGVISLTQGMARSGSLSLPNPVLAFCCAVAPMVYLTVGRIMAYIGSLKLWDMAGALAILTASGCTVRFSDGTDVVREVNGALYHLEEGDPRRWYTQRRLICAPSEEVFRYIADGIDRLA